MTNEAEDQMSKAMMRVMRTSPYYSNILMRHKKVQDPEVNGAVINGSELRYNPDMIMEIPTAEMAENLKHMAMHIAYGHHLRAARMKPRHENRCEEGHVKFEQIFNEAADLAVNSLLRSSNEANWHSGTLKDAPLPGRGEYGNFSDGLSAEEYFGKVLDIRWQEDPPFGGGGNQGEGGSGSDGESQGQGQGEGEGEQPQAGQGQGEGGQPQAGQGQGSGQQQQEHRNWGQVEEPSKPIHEAEQEHQEQIGAAAMAAKQAGEQTASVKKMILEYEAPVKVDWKAETREFIQQVVRGRPNYKTINRRMFGGSIVFPTHKDRSPKKCAMIVDVSGSMDDKCVAAVFDHVEALINAHPTLEIILAQFDYDVFEDSVVTYDRNNIPIACDERGRTGYGGTRFMPAIEWAEKQEDVSGIIMLTDLMPCDRREFDEHEPEYPMIVLSVYDYQFGGNGWAHKAEPEHMKVLEIEPE